MKVLMMNTSDINGGAARAAYRLHTGLSNIGVQSQMLVQQKFSDDPCVYSPKSRIAQGIARARVAVDSLPLKLYRQCDSTRLSLQWLPDKNVERVQQISPDIINLHWTGEAFLRLENLAKFTQPLVWTLHDMTPFTGGCFYSHNCDRYTNSCGQCPQLYSTKEWDLSRWVWQRKQRSWQNLNLTVVALSSWLAKCASASSLFRNVPIQIIPNGIDINQYKPINRQVARELLNLPQNKQLLLFGSLKATSDKRKGFHLLQPALGQLSQSGWNENIELVIFGASPPENPPELGFKVHYLNTLKDDLSLALVYSAADVFILPSVQENLANTVMEALACGTPCVAFHIGGMPDMIEHQRNGYLAKPYQIEDLAQGIIWVLDNLERYQKLCDRAREKVEQEFTLDIQAHSYLQLFQDILS